MLMRIRIPLFTFDADPDLCPTFKSHADPDPAPCKSDKNIRPQAYTVDLP